MLAHSRVDQLFCFSVKASILLQGVSKAQLDEPRLNLEEFVLPGQISLISVVL